MINELVKVFKNTQGEIVTDSLKIAEDFAKGKHGDVTRKIQGLEISEDFRLLNIKSIEYKDARNRTQIKYELTKDGFMMLIMHYQGYTSIKEQYVKEYSDMEKFILDSNLSEEFKYYRQTGKIARRELTDTIKDVLHPSNQFVYSNYTNLIYKKLFGMSSKQLKESKGLKKSDNLRDYLTPDELGMVLTLEKRVDAYIVTLHDMELDNSDVYSKIKNLINK